MLRQVKRLGESTHGRCDASGLRRSIRSLSALTGGLLLAGCRATALRRVCHSYRMLPPRTPLRPAGKKLTAAQQAKQAKDAKAAAETQRGKVRLQPSKAYAAGVKAFEAGDIQGAEQQLSVALAGGGLPERADGTCALLSRFVLSPTRTSCTGDFRSDDGNLAQGRLAGRSQGPRRRAKLAYQEAGLGNTPPPVGAPTPAQSASGAPSAPKPGTGTQVVQVTEKGSGVACWRRHCPAWAGSSRPRQRRRLRPPHRRGAQQPSSFWNFLPSIGGGLRSRPRAYRLRPQASRRPRCALPWSASAPAMRFAAPAEAAQTSRKNRRGLTNSVRTTAAAQPGIRRLLLRAMRRSTMRMFPRRPHRRRPRAAAVPRSLHWGQQSLSGADGGRVRLLHQHVRLFVRVVADAAAESAAVTTGSTRRRRVAGMAIRRS